MADEQARTEAVPVYEAVGSQRDATLDETPTEIDILGGKRSAASTKMTVKPVKIGK